MVRGIGGKRRLIMLTPAKINKALKAENIPGSIVRSPKGYYYFIGGLFDIVPAIYSHNLNGWSIDEIINHIKKHYEQ